MSSCPFDGDCPMLAYVASDGIRRAMRRLLCAASYDECIWLRVKQACLRPDDECRRRMQRVLVRLEVAA